jgi:hypothetical protein
MRFRQNKIRATVPNTDYFALRTNNNSRVKLGPNTVSLYGRNRITANIQDTKLVVETDTDSTKVLNAENNLWFVFTNSDSLVVDPVGIFNRLTQSPVSPPAIDFDPFFAADTSGFCQEGQSEVLRLPREGPVDGEAPLAASGLDVPTRLELGRPYPNPGRNGVEVRLSVPPDKIGDYTFAVYNVGGRAVSRRSEAISSAGRFLLRWNGRGDSGMDVAAGIYFLRMSGPEGFEEIRRVTILR